MGTIVGLPKGVAKWGELHTLRDGRDRFRKTVAVTWLFFLTMVTTLTAKSTITLYTSGSPETKKLSIGGILVIWITGCLLTAPFFWNEKIRRPPRVIGENA
jgi:hypothetical protein